MDAIAVTSYRQLLDEIKKLPPPAEGTVRLFRGQTKDYSAILSSLGRTLRTRPAGEWFETRIKHLYIKAGLLSVVGELLRLPQLGPIDIQVSVANYVLADALVQHYGYQTSYVDVSPSIDVALWFATHRFEGRMDALAISFQLIGWFGALQSTLNDINLLPGRGEFTLWALLKGLVVISAFVLVTSVLARAFERRIMTVESIALSTRIGVTKFSYFFLVGLGILLGINAAGVDLTALTVLTGAVGLGLGFGLQSIASNFVSGVVLLMDKSIKPGDVISFTGMPGTSTESFGWVQALRGRYVVVRDRDGVETLVPNQQLINSPVINWSYSDLTPGL